VKQFLVLLAVLPLMLIVMMEFVLDTTINTKVDAINDIVYVNREIARQDGTFKNVAEKLKNELSKATGVGLEEISLDGTYLGEPKERLTSLSAISSDNDMENYLVHYRIAIPVSEMKSLGRLLSSDKQKHIYVIDSYVASEYVGLAQ